MSLTPSMLQSADVSRFGWTLVHSLWQGAGIAALLTLTLLVLRRRSSQSRYVAGCAAMMLLLAAPIATFLFLQPPPQPTSITWKSTAMTDAPSAIEPTPHAIASGEDDRIAVAPLRTRVNNPDRQFHADNGSFNTVAPASAPATPRIRAQQIFPWIVGVWALGVAAMSLWNLGGWIALQRLKSIGAAPASKELEQLLASLCSRLGLRRIVRVVESARVRSPLVIGAFKPIILIPASVLCELPLAQLESILAHELAHIRRHDYLVNLIQSVIETLLFYHPATWWISRVIRIERENCCDDIALNLYPDRSAYATALANIAAAKTPPLAVAARGGLLLGRIQRILGIPQTESRRAGGWATGVLGLLICLTLASLLAKPINVKAEQAAATQPAATQPAGTMDLLVVDADTKLPIANAEVNWLREIKMQKRSTDASGHVQVEYGELQRLGATFAVYAKHDGYVETGVYIRTSTEFTPIPKTFTLAIPRGTRIGGIVVNEEKEPVAGATIRLELRRNAPAVDPEMGIPFPVVRPENSVTTTNASGRWTYDMAPADPMVATLEASHPEYTAPEGYPAALKVPTAELRSMSTVAVLKKGVTIAGWVDDENGKPIASARVAMGRFDYTSAPIVDTQSKADGTFTLPRSRDHRPVILIATAQGREPQDVRLDLDGDKTDLQIRMPPSKTFKFATVDRDGNPLPDVEIYLSGWHGLQRPFDLKLRSDKDGHATWTQAPGDAVAFRLGKARYLSLDVQRTASVDEQQIVLQPALNVTGNVVDDADGKPIPSFKVVKGWLYAGRPDFFWEPARFGRQRVYELGRFEYAENDPRDGLGIRIEADGYMPQASRVIKPGEGDVILQYRLKKAEPIQAQLVSTDGKPLAGADVIVCTGSNQVRIGNGKPSASTMALQTKADSDGRFKLSAQPGEYEILVLHDAGFADLKPDQINERIVVQPWGRIEGIAKIGGRPAGDVRVAARYTVFPKGQPYYWLEDDATIDASGHYELTHLPPTTVYAMLETAVQRDTYTYYQQYGKSEPVEVHAGEATHFDIDGSGRPIIGQIVAPPEIMEKGDWRNIRGMITTKIDVRAGIGDRELRRQQQANIKRYQVKIAAGGSFRIDDLPEGTYTLSITLNRRGVGEQQVSSEQLATASLDFSVAAMPAGRSKLALDLGTIGLTERKPLAVGDIAPPLTINTLDVKSTTLKDLHGKVVLVNFWATWCKPCVDELWELKETYDEFKSDPNFTMVSMSLDEAPDVLRDFVRNHKLDWTQGFIGAWQKSNVPNQWGLQTIPSTFLIAPDGTIAAVDLHDFHIKVETRKALAAIPR